MRYAFSRRNEGVRFFCPYVVGETTIFMERAYASHVDIVEPGEPPEPFLMKLCGFDTLVALRRPAKWVAAGQHFVDRVNELRLDTLTLQFDWSDDPPQGE